MDRKSNKLERITIHLYESDVEFFRKRFGYGWSGHIRHVMRREVNHLIQLDNEFAEFDEALKEALNGD